ncbi:LOW QUALITY PROTEIN: Retrotransposon protein, Ty1-Copia subclass [Phytophthora megakarya]|uniref:Retrotransposon protein, Ty1-Copia subclass n=1 Tax=Phytophthora megakarya TaxID=4795 RepID=A0A225X2B7_9STRA|nr:LOW QUALITY PROTEIN: Retrotransposon protein, Ty1-Copia subclass [Phytophthora megakarya]
MSVVTEPETFQEAMQSDEHVHWQRAAQDEYRALMITQTWVLVPREKRMKNTMRFCVKYIANGYVKRDKARLVIKGIMQIYGVDYLEVYSPVVRLETLRVLLTLAAVWNYEIHQMDVTAFLNGNIDVEVYMEQAERFKVQGKEDCTPRVWFQLLNSFLLEQGFTILELEGCVAVKVIDNQLVLIPLYVDDLILFAPTMQLLNDMKRMFVSALRDEGS